MKALAILLCAAMILALGGSVSATVLHVPAEYPTIQAGINAAVSGDTVLVTDGTYSGSGNRDLDFYGKAIVVMSENGPDVTIIDCEGSPSQSHRGFYFHSGETPSAVVQGFTIRNGWVSSYGGAIYCIDSSPTIVGNTMTGNRAYDGGAIHCRYQAHPTIADNRMEGNTGVRTGGAISLYIGSPAIVNNTIVGNECTGPVNGRGGGIYCSGSWASITGNLIVGNTSYGGGGGILTWNLSHTTIEGNTIAGNTAGNPGGAIYCDDHATVMVANSVLWGNNSSNWSQIYLAGGSSIIVTYSDVEGGWPGEGNIDGDPLFVTGPLGDYYLSQTLAGQPEQSPCADAGDPDSSVPEGTTRTDEVCDVWPVDMGYHYQPCTAGPTPPLWVDVTPDTTQIPRGEDLWFEVDIVNTTDSTLTFDGWVDVYHPNGNPYAGNPVLGPVELTVGAGFGMYDVRRHVHIPTCAPYGGPYGLCVRTGVHQDTVWAEDCFEFAIVPPPVE